MSLDSNRVKELDKLCAVFRRDVIKTLYERQTGHPGGSLSVCEILTALYFEQANVDPQNPGWPQRDRIILTKGHAAPMLYRVLAEKGYFPLEKMSTLRCIGTELQGHPHAGSPPGVEATTGPLGLGLSVAVGEALGLRLSGINAYVYAVMGDGELNEGVVWEACMSASKYSLDKLIAIVDNNHVQLDGSSGEIMPMGSLEDKFSAFGFNVLSCGGHDVAALCTAIERAKANSGKPSVIIADTVKGKGVSYMEGKNTWHGSPIGNKDYKTAMAELEAGI